MKIFQYYLLALSIIILIFSFNLELSCEDMILKSKIIS